MLNGNIQDMIRVPISTAIPAFALYYTGLTSSDIQFNGNEIVYEFSPVSMKVVKESVYNELPKIDAEF